MRKTILALAAVFLPLVAWAEDLDVLHALQPTSPGTVSPSGPACTGMPGQEPARELVLTVRAADRMVGPYTVRLPGYSTSTNPTQGNTYVPPLIRVDPGNTLRVDLINQLTDEADGSDEINLHTHGLIVQPRRCSPFGDSIYVEDGPGNLARYAIAIPKTLPGDMFGGSGPDLPYPPGLNWLHAHVHGKARADVMAGQSAILQVGDTKAALLAAASDQGPAADMLRTTDTVYLGLRDIQLAVPKGQTPDKAKSGARAIWLDADYDPTACQNLSDPPLSADPPATSRMGWCTHPGVTMNGSMVTDQDTAWLFTINGQLAPTVRQHVGRSQLWNIVNLSSNVTYRLQLVADDAPATLMDMQVVSVDGLLVGTTRESATGLHVGVPMKSLVLMPAGRAEVFIPAGTADRGQLTLGTGGLLTGWPLTAAADPFPTGPQGDPWPAIDLAHVAGPPAAPRAAAVVAAAQVPRVLDLTLPGGTRNTAPLVPGGRPAVPGPRTPAAGAPPANCVVLPADGTATRRHVVFDTDTSGAVFELASEVLTKDGTPVTSTSIPLQSFPHAAMTDPGSVAHICPRLGDMEVWELDNQTTELHNFHIHQTKFRLAKQTDPGAPDNMVPFQDPNGILGHYLSGGGAEALTNNSDVDLWHDTLPIPPAKFDGQGKMVAPGRIFVTIPFRAREQAGFFVFHCHILEHEDGGMMAVVQVFDPANPGQAEGAKRSNMKMAPLMTPAAFDRWMRTNMCRTPTAEFAPGAAVFGDGLR